MMWGFAAQNLWTRTSRTSLAVIGLTIPVLAFLGLFSVTQGIRDLMGSALGKMQGLMVLRVNSPAPVFSDLPAEMAETLKTIPGIAVIAPEVWRISPPIDGKGGMGSAALGFLTRPRDSALKSIAEMVVIEGQDLPSHLRLEGALFKMSILPEERGGGRALGMEDVGKNHILISTKIARDHPNADGSPKRVGQSLRIGTQKFTIVGIYETGTLVTDMTIVMEIGVARKLLGVSEKTVSTFDIEPDRTSETDSLARRIESKVPGVQVQRISQFNLTVGAILGKLELFLLLAVSLAMLVGGVGIANTMLMSTSERYVEFGVMRANGWTKRNILALISTESALLGLISAILGCALALAGILILNRFLTGFRLNLRPWLLGAGLLGAPTIAVLAGLYPAWRASRLTPMDAIRRGGAM